jgi:hypothetical protein
LLAHALLAGGIVFLTAPLLVLVWPWRIEATLKATTRAAVISLAGGLEVAGLSASAAVILGGPGVIAVRLRTRELWRRPIPCASLDALLAWVEELLARPAAPPGLGARIAARAKAWLLPRTDVTALPAFGLRALTALRDVALEGTLVCGFRDAALTGKAAAWLYPLAGVLAPLGALDLRFDWSGQPRLDGDVDLRARVVLLRLGREGLRFARHHIHPCRAVAPTLSTSIPT